MVLRLHRGRPVRRLLHPPEDAPAAHLPDHGAARLHETQSGAGQRGDRADGKGVEREPLQPHPQQLPELLQRDVHGARCQPHAWLGGPRCSNRLGDREHFPECCRAGAAGLGACQERFLAGGHHGSKPSAHRRGGRTATRDGGRRALAKRVSAGIRRDHEGSAGARRARQTRGRAGRQARPGADAGVLGRRGRGPRTGGREADRGGRAQHRREPLEHRPGGAAGGGVRHWLPLRLGLRLAAVLLVPGAARRAGDLLPAGSPASHVCRETRDLRRMLLPRRGWGESHGLPTVQLVPLHLLLQEEGAGEGVAAAEPAAPRCRRGSRCCVGVA
mmetsp:Transcript_10158/g.28827  ORF Transcript_10158/g.28827 Transcript_10158/m.28827 type:complete len:330 (+) Transcript_10158:345-1334(+)